MNDESQDVSQAPAIPGPPADPETAASEFPQSQLPFPVVGIGASAGGVEAYTQLLTALAPDTGMAFVLVPHLSAEHESHLVEILARHSSMPVSQAGEGVQPQPNNVYVIPRATRLSLSDGKFHLEDRLPGRLPTIDHFFRSLAAEQKNRAVGVLLSGMDSDGALGLKAIKGEGGIAIVQNPESAQFREMPRSGIAVDHVDLILPPPQIGLELTRLARQFDRPELAPLEQGEIEPKEEQYFTRILTLLRGVSGIDFRLYKATTLRRRIARRMLVNKSETLSQYVQLLQSRPEELRDLQEDALINVTRFFRDPDVFEVLAHDIFPRLFEQQLREQQARVWVPGCSSGEEAYSIAISLLEYFTGQPVEPAIQIFGTDVSEQSIEKARTGFYPQSIIADVSPERLHRFFVPVKNGYQVSKRVRDLCIFARQDLSSDPPFSRLHLISCRNVLIYLDPTIQKSIMRTFNYALRQEGYLLLGTSESIGNHADLFTLIDRKHKIYGKVPAAPPIADLAPRLAVHERLDHNGASTSALAGWSEIELQRAADRIVVARYGPAGVVINDQLEVLQVRGHTAAYIEHMPGIPSLNILRMARPSLALVLRDAIQRAVSEDVPVKVDHVNVRDGDMARELTLEVLPIQSAPPRKRCYLVLFLPRPEAKPREITDEPTEIGIRTGADEKGREIDRLREDLGSTRLYLQSLIEERDARNQELTSAYEEIQSSNEELQSTNEELETAKEELQSTNEELQTVNEELRLGNAALLQANNDVSNLLNSVNIPVLMLGSDLTIRHFTPSAERLMHVRSSDVGRRIGEIRLNLTIDDVEPLLQEVLETLGTREVDVQDKQGRWYILRIRPYRTAENKIDGLVLVLVDVDQIRRGEQAMREARDLAQCVVELVRVPLTVLDEELRITMANAAFRALCGIPKPEIERRSFPELTVLLWNMEQVRPLLESLRAAGQEFEIEHETPAPDQRVFCVGGRAVQLEGRRALLITVDDITVRRQAERLMQRERERLAGQVRTTEEELSRTQKELRALAASLFTSQEEERRRIARELHDDVSQRLAMLANEFEHLRRNIPENPAEVRNSLEMLRGRAEALSDDLRNISHALHPSILEDLGLASALRSLVTEFSDRERMPADFTHANVPPNLPDNVSSALYRITQEALRNIAKHAGRTHVRVSLTGADSSLRLMVRDLGEGFDPTEGRGLGLISMEERARLIGAFFKVTSALGEGTTVQVDAPADII
ncbi:MAG: CheR family methyltransferase [Bryobacteraceae bacterium]